MDLRHNAWEFFPAILHPDKASTAAVDLIQGLQKQDRGREEFERYEDGTPILYLIKPDGTGMKRRELVNVLRDYMRIHCGQCDVLFVEFLRY